MRIRDWSSDVCSSDLTRKVTARVGLIADVMREADQVGRDRRHQIISVEDVEDALAAQRYRSDRVERRMGEQVLRETIRTATDGEAVGPVNGLEGDRNRVVDETRGDVRVNHGGSRMIKKKTKES